MDSDQLFHVRQLFYQGNYSSCISTATPLATSSPSSPEEVSYAVYAARAHLALSPPQTSQAISLLEPLTEDHVEAKAVSHLAEFLSSTPYDSSSPSLDALRDILIELEESESTPQTGIAKAAAATAFVLAEELEEAVDVLSQESRNLECVALLVQVYLSMNRLDMAKKTYEAAKSWGEDSLLVQLMEAWIAMRTQGPSLQQAYYVYDELLSLPSGRTPTILASHAAAHLLLGHIEEARGDVQVILALEGDYEASAQQLKGIAAAIMGRTKEGEELVKMLGGAGGGDKMREMEDKFDVAAAKFGVAAA